MKRQAVALLTLSTLLAACGSLDQAALIYSSRIVGGVDVSAGATENQGVSLNIGFKTVDFAYVPVAVAASAPGAGVTPLAATHSEDLSDAAKRLPPDGEQRVTSYMQAKDELSRRRQSVASHERNVSQASAEKKGEAQKRLDSAKSKLAEAQSAFDKAAEEAAVDLEQLRLKMSDAMSVFGRFDGRGLGSGGTAKAEASLTVGRIFSTGVAAQKLTRAAVIEAHSSCLQRYFAVIEKAAEAERSALAAKVNEACKPPAD